MSSSYGSYVKRHRYNYFCFTVCPSNFIHLGSINGCYKVVTSNMEWAVAGLHCRSLHKDAHLLVINDDVEQTSIGALIDSTDSQFI